MPTIVVQVHKTDQGLLPTCTHSFVECGRMQVPHSPAKNMRMQVSLNDRVPQTHTNTLMDFGKGRGQEKQERVGGFVLNETK